MKLYLCTGRWEHSEGYGQIQEHIEALFFSSILAVHQNTICYLPGRPTVLEQEGVGKWGQPKHFWLLKNTLRGFCKMQQGFTDLH